MKTLQRVLLGLRVVVLLSVASAALADPKVELGWSPHPLVTDSLAPGESATYTVVMNNLGKSSLAPTSQFRIVAEGAIEPYVSITQPVFPNGNLPKGAEVSFKVAVSVPADAPLEVRYGKLLLQRVLPNGKIEEVWRAEALPVSIAIRSYALLNDTGITLCGDADRNDLPCPVDGFPGQDAEFGRDVTHNDDSDGHAGFSFTKLDANGSDLPEDATEWFCVRDNVTGRVWEVKTDDDRLRDKDWTYTWYNSDPNTNGGDDGAPDGGVCVESNCDTEGYVQAVNAQGLCGASDWRMPNPRELISIVNSDRFPGIDDALFPNVVSWLYWSASSQHSFSQGAANVQLVNGHINYTFKSVPAYVLLMREHP